MVQKGFVCNKPRALGSMQFTSGKTGKRCSYPICICKEWNADYRHGVTSSKSEFHCNTIRKKARVLEMISDSVLNHFAYLGQPNKAVIKRSKIRKEHKAAKSETRQQNEGANKEAT